MSSKQTTTSDSEAIAQHVRRICERARRASYAVAASSAEQRSRALELIASSIRDHADTILKANAQDMEAGASHLSKAMLDRLELDGARLEGVARAVGEVATMDDLVGQVVSQSVRPNGLEVSRVRIPLGVVAMIYESRPNVTSDAAALCLRSGNATILRGGKEAFHSNQALASAVRAGLEGAGLPSDAVQVFDTTERAALMELLQQEELVDLVIPRGGEGLIRFVSEHSRVPVLKHYKGVCHVYVHAAADHEMALNIAVNAKAQRPGTCNSAETILVDEAIAESFVPKLTARLGEAGVEIRGDERSRALGGTVIKEASEADWEAEYLDKIVALRVVSGLDQAVQHIHQYGSNHTEAIITGDSKAAERFLSVVHSSTVVVNASTRFADGGELGLGAEIGISTTKLHAYGPMGAEGLTTTRFVVRGSGQVRS